jgi:hypothetical protein
MPWQGLDFFGTFGACPDERKGQEKKYRRIAAQAQVQRTKEQMADAWSICTQRRKGAEKLVFGS